MTGNVCEKPDDAENCRYLVPNEKVEGQYICQNKCDNIIYQDKYCFESCPSGMIEVAPGVCDIDCILFYNGKCVSECSNTQEKVGYVCMD